MLPSFERQCHQVNNLLLEKNLFLRECTNLKKIRYLIEKGANKNEVARDLSTCFEERFNRFDIVKNLQERKEKEEFQPIDIVYQPVKKYDEVTDCYFTDSIHEAYRTTMSQDRKKDKLEFLSVFYLQ